MNKGRQTTGVQVGDGLDAAATAEQRALSAGTSVAASRAPVMTGKRKDQPAAKRRSPSQQRGDLAEQRAYQYLIGQGLTLVARNVGSTLGEIDLVMRDRDSLVFVEVRQRSRPDFGGAAASVTVAKQQRLRREAQRYLLSRFGDRWPACRFDVIAIETDVIHWIPNAF